MGVRVTQALFRRRRLAPCLAALLLLCACDESPTRPTPPPAGMPIVTVTIVGSGSVTSVPSGLSCLGGTCSANFPAGWQISLYAGSGSGWTFAGWKGACNQATNRCDLTVDASPSVTATFMPSS